MVLDWAVSNLKVPLNGQAWWGAVSLSLMIRWTGQSKKCGVGDSVDAIFGKHLGHRGNKSPLPFSILFFILFEIEYHSVT